MTFCCDDDAIVTSSRSAASWLPSTDCPHNKADRIAEPTAVVVIAFPAKSWISDAVSVVKDILFKGKPCSKRTSSGARALPASEAKNRPEGVMHGEIPN